MVTQTALNLQRSGVPFLRHVPRGMKKLKLALFIVSALLALLVVFSPVDMGSSVMQGRRLRSIEAPLVSVTILTTSVRAEYLQFALRRVLGQTYPNIEIVVVDDSDSEFDPATVPLLAHPSVQYHHVDRQLTIGEKRNVAVGFTNGEVVVTWDDDDVFPEDRIQKQVQPILSGETDLTVLQFDKLAWVRPDSISYFTFNRPGEHCGTLSYRRSLWGSGANQSLFPNVSVAEDAYFADQVLRRCACTRILKDISSVYGRHTSFKNTWNWHGDQQEGQGPWSKLTPADTPGYMSSEEEVELRRAEASSGHHPQRAVLNQWNVPGFFESPRFWPHATPDWCAGMGRCHAVTKRHLQDDMTWETYSSPTPVPTPAPTSAPESAPTPADTSTPTPAPTSAPTPADTSAPTPAPTSAPTPVPTSAPTPAPTPAPLLKTVSTEVVIAGVDFDKVNDNATLKDALIDEVKDAFLANMTNGYTKQDIAVTLSRGSVKATVVITPKSDSDATALQSSIAAGRTDVSNTILAKVTDMAQDSDVLETGMTLGDLTVVVNDPLVFEDEGPASFDAAGVLWPNWVVFVFSALIMASLTCE